MILKNWGVQTNRSTVTTFVAKNKASVPCSKLTEKEKKNSFTKR
jgi:hypothetical protein